MIISVVAAVIIQVMRCEMALDHVSTWALAGVASGEGERRGSKGMLVPSGSGLISRLVKTRKARALGRR
jgi:hypothetical protein